MSDYHGHKTHMDGSHTPLTKEEAEALWQACEDAKAREAEAMPEAWDATSAIISAKRWLSDLGWRKGGGFSVKKGDQCAIMELDSTGIWTGWLDDQGKYFHYCDCVADRQKVWAKPLNELTDGERARMTRCNEDDRQHQEAMHAVYAAMSESTTEDHGS